MKQATLATGGFEIKRKTTHKAEFLSRMDKLVPWAELCAVIEPFYPKAGNGRPPIGLERILRMYFIAHWFNLADEACEDALYDIAAFRDFCRIDLGREGVPDATSLLGFRHLLEKHELGAAMFAKVGELLQSNGLRLSGGTIVDATIIAAPGSTKNAGKARDPEMHQTKKGNQWHFGMKVHIGADSKSGLVHSTSVTPANAHGSQELPNLMRGNETRLYGDSAYANQKEKIKEAAPKAKDFTNKRAFRNKPLSDADKETNRRKSRVRAKAPLPPVQESLWLRQGALSRVDEKRQPRFCAAGADQYREMGATFDRGSPSRMSRMGEEPPEKHPGCGVCKEENGQFRS